MYVMILIADFVDEKCKQAMRLRLIYFLRRLKPLNC